MTDVERYQPTERFSNRAKLYSQARPDYPERALEFICKQANLDAGKTIADLGAGTGISTRAFAARDINVWAIEPNEAMLVEARSNPEFQNRIKYLNARAEETGLPENTFDAIVCAQAFHWFNPEKALFEFKRILKEEAWVFLLWNERDESDSFTKDYGDLIRTLPDTSLVEVHRGESGKALLESPIFKNKNKTCFEHAQIMDESKLISRAFSSSYSPLPGSPEAAAFQQKLQLLFEAYQNNGFLSLKYQCSVYFAQPLVK